MRIQRTVSITCVLLFSACGTDTLHVDGGSALIGAQGGVIALEDGASIEVPAGALSQDVMIRLSPDAEAQAVTGGARAVGPYYRFSPQGTTFTVPAIITLPFDTTALDGDSEIVVRTAPDGTADYSAVPTEPLDGTRVRAFITHFSDVVPTARSVQCHGSGSCNDGNPCTFGDRCRMGTCSGTPYSCNDGNACTNDSCNGSGGCNFVNNTAPCNDGNACTSGDVCSGGACRGTPYTCNDGNVCTNDACNGTGGCTFTNNTAPCNDGNACTFGDTCGAGICGAGTPYTCNDSNPCTDDACDGAGGCIFTPVLGCACPDPELECASGPNCPGGYICRADGCCVPSCFDGIWNDSEGDVDCGVYCPTRCANGKHCWEGSDCQSGVCTNNHCQ